ncbi:MDR family MFS transporter [Tumebacillus permanentifrigoris]|uniref:EmrB/QacA subfamily drug resistance transporter n=1 Tax=Tumebacillus permanentifrigoris TaxID=378543 RepID=A0A316D5U5_9BACL|nr:MDR family MFS transporter [Tumebacillus permanentifrigoris]PWK09616.1 EmrB/QacA subfamily drug resistance transporter [Tumebacillus permanentifrigoris]
MAEVTSQAGQLDLEAKGGKRRLVIIGLLLGLFFSSLDQTVVGTAMPTIIGQLGHIELLTWITTAYLLTSTSVVPIAGKLADVFGRRSLYLIGMVVFIIGSALCGAADSMIQLTIYRGIQGIGGGMLMPLAMTIIGDITTGESRAKFQGMFMAVFGLSSVLGPQLGGWIVDYWSWNWIFYINLPFGVLATIFIWIGLGNSFEKKKVVIDYAGIVTMIIAIVSLLLALSLGGKDYGWTSWQIIALFISFVVFSLVFLYVESRAKDPILPLYLFKNRIFTIVILIGFLMSLGMFGALTFSPLLMQGVVGMSATKAASVMTPMMFGMIATSILGSRLLLKVGLRPMLIGGMGIMVIGFLLFSQLGLDTTQLSASMVMIVLGLGMGMIMPSLGIAVQEAFPMEIRGTVTSSTTFFRSIGGTVGIALLGAVFNHRSVADIGNQLDPVLSQMGPNSEKLLDMAHNNPQGLYSSLLSPDFLQALPKPVAEMFNTSVTPILKDSLLDSLHALYHVSIWFCVAGLVVALFTGKVKFSGNPRGAGGKKDAASSAQPAAQE